MNQREFILVLYAGFVLLVTFFMFYKCDRHRDDNYTHVELRKVEVYGPPKPTPTPAPR